MDPRFRPKIKLFIEHCSLNGKIYFFKRPGVAVELDDPSHFISTACNLMDGKKTVVELQQAVFYTHPKESAYLTDLLSALDAEFLLENTSINIPSDLSEYDVNRWSRNAEFFSAYSHADTNKYSHQAKLKSSIITILGLGGLGTNLLYNLAAIGIQNIRIVDYDKVELSNLNRQILYTEADIGRKKTEAAKDRILQFSPQMNIETYDKKLSCIEDIFNIISGSDIVVGAADQPRDKIIDWINAASVQHNIPFICGGLDSQWAVYYSVIPKKTGCIECWKSQAKKSNYLYQDWVQQKEFTHAASPNVIIMPFVSILSGLMVSDIIKIVTGISEPKSLEKLCAFDFVSANTSIVETWEKNAACLICSR